MRKGVGNTTVVTSPTVSSHRSKPVLCSDSLTCGAELTVGPAVSHSGCIDRVHLVVAPGWKLYLELGVSKWGEPNFVGFILKCTI